MLSKLLSGSIDPNTALEHLRNGGTINVVIHNHGKKSGPDEEGPEEDAMEYGEEPEDAQDVETPAETRAEGGQEEPGMMGAVRRALAPPPKAPSPGVGKGPAHPQTKPGSAKIPSKMAKPAAGKKPPVKKAASK